MFQMEPNGPNEHQDTHLRPCLKKVFRRLLLFCFYCCFHFFSLSAFVCSVMFKVDNIIQINLIHMQESSYNLVGVSSCVGRTNCWPEYKSLRKKCINSISTHIDRYDQRPPGEIFNFEFQCTLVVSK